MSDSTPSFVLYTYFRSSCSGRLRIALALKDIKAQHIGVNLLHKDQLNDEFSLLNASQSVPVLVDQANNDFPIGQSIAALEYLEEAYPDKKQLLPPLSDPLARAKVRVLVNIIACDTQPVTNLRLVEEICDPSRDVSEWMKKWISKGLRSYELTLSKTAGKYSVGDEITLADVCLIPAVWGAERYSVDMSSMPQVTRVYKTMSGEKAVQSAHWKNQPDTPEGLRVHIKK